MGGLIFIAVIIAWLWFCVWLARKVVSWIPIKSGGLKGLIGLLTFAILLPLPLIDEIIGKEHRDRLCRNEAGLKIYEKLKLDPEYFNPDGTTNLVGKVNIDDKRLDPLIDIVYLPLEKIPSIARLTKQRMQIIDRKNNRVLAEQTGFNLEGGMLAYDRQPWLSKVGCIQQRQLINEIIRQIITQK